MSTTKPDPLGSDIVTHLSGHEALNGVGEDDHTAVEEPGSVSNSIITTVVVEEIT